MVPFEQQRFQQYQPENYLGLDKESDELKVSRS